MAYPKKRTNQRYPVKKKGKSSYGKRSYPYASATPADGQQILVSSYFEVEAVQPAADADGGLLAYSIQMDPMNCLLTSTGVGNGVTVLKRDGNNNAIVDGGTLSFGRLAEFSKLYRQYRINSCTVKITTDRVCGLDNPLLALCDRGDATPISTVGSAMGQAHKSVILTESSRTMSYGWKPSTPEEREYSMITQGIGALNLNFIKILQEMEKQPDCVLKHKVELMFSVTLKDSKSVSGN